MNVIKINYLWYIQITVTPSMFLVYRNNFAQEYRGTPSKQFVKDFVKSAMFFHSIAEEEIQLNDMIKEGKQCLDTGKLESAIEIFKEANSLERWKDLYGSIILSCLGKISMNKE